MECIAFKPDFLKDFSEIFLLHFENIPHEKQMKSPILIFPEMDCYMKCVAIVS